VSDRPSVIEALSAVMEDVQAVKKGDRNTQQGYAFRGVDAVVNAVGPALRRHGVVVVPVGSSYEADEYVTQKGTRMRGVTMTVRFRFYGPAGDHIDAEVCGESSDSGDKAVPKAHSVAYRTLLLEALCIPTDEPDPDAESHERAASEPDLPDTLKAGDDPSLKPENPVPEQNRLITDAQLRLLWKTWRETGLEDERLRDLILEVTGETSTKGIRRAQVDEVMAGIARLAVDAPVKFEAPDTVQEKLA
jgi:hypothetical protein